MLHHTRRWEVNAVEDPGELVDKLHEHNWCLCTAFETSAGTIWANDSTGPGPEILQEYAVLRPEGDRYRQVETITVSWCSEDNLFSYLQAADRGEFDGQTLGTVNPEQLQINDEHTPCPHCA